MSHASATWGEPEGGDQQQSAVPSSSLGGCRETAHVLMTLLPIEEGA